MQYGNRSRGSAPAGRCCLPEGMVSYQEWQQAACKHWTELPSACPKYLLCAASSCQSNRVLHAHTQAALLPAAPRQERGCCQRQPAITRLQHRIESTVEQPHLRAHRTCHGNENWIPHAQNHGSSRRIPHNNKKLQQLR